MQTLVATIFNVAQWVIGIILAPISLVVENYFPSLDALFSKIDELFELITPALGYAVSWTFLSNSMLSAIVLFYTFSLSLPIALFTIRLFYKWYHFIRG